MFYFFFNNEGARVPSLLVQDKPGRCSVSAWVLLPIQTVSLSAFLLFYGLYFNDLLQREFFSNNTFQYNTEISWVVVGMLSISMLQQMILSAVYVEMIGERIFARGMFVSSWRILALFALSLSLVGLEVFNPVNSYLHASSRAFTWWFRSTQSVFGVVCLLYGVKVL